MRISANGQITIPAELRKKLGLYPKTEVVVEISDDGLFIRKKRDPEKIKQLIERMTGKGDVELTTDQIMHLTRGED